MSLVLSVIIGMTVLVFTGMTLAPLFLHREDARPESETPRFRVIEGGKSTSFDNAA